MSVIIITTTFFTVPLHIAIVMAIFACTCISLIKEVYDVYFERDNTHKESAEDFVADLLGLAFGIITGLIFAIS